jgi:DUF4097 and DUF4098 domain-containing protein YvlB
MRAAKIGLLFLILLFGATVETAWQVRDHIELGPMGCRVLGGRFYGPSYSFESEESQPVSAPAAPVAVDNSFGSVQVVGGEAGQVKVRLRKVVFRPTETEARAFAERIRLVLTNEGGRLRIATNREQLEEERRGQRQVGFETHLVITVPADTPLTVRNDHGGVEAADVADADLGASFDDVTAERIGGALKVDVQHGGAEVRQVRGPLTVTGRYGDVRVEDAKDTVDVQLEHGSVTLARVGATKVTTTNGSIKADGVSGDLEARADHGSVQATQVAGKAVVSTTYDGIEVRHVDGEARLKAEHGSVVAEDVQGAVNAESSFDDVHLLRIGKDVDVTVDHGGVEAEDLAGGARVKASGDDVRLKDFAASVEVEADRGSVELTPSGPIAHPLSVRTQHGGITLRVPPGSSLDLEAASVHGELEIDVPGWTAERTEKSRTFGRIGKGGVVVKLDADRGDVRVFAAGLANEVKASTSVSDDSDKDDR